MTSGLWGSGYWGSGLWGGGGFGSGLTLLSANAVRENVVRVELNAAVYFTGYKDTPDASIAAKYALAPVSGSAGDDGEATRAVTVVAADLSSAADVGDEGVGRFLDLTLDRPMTSYPGLYTLALSDLYSDDLTQSLAAASAQVFALFKEQLPPTLESPAATGDLANPQTLRGAPGSTSTTLLGTLSYDGSGDYALDGPDAGLRKRAVRRMLTRRDGFAHLPGYGVGLPQYGKQLSRPSTIAQVVAEGEKQISAEPDCARVRVVATRDPDEPGLVNFQLLLKPVAGQAVGVTMPFRTR